MRGRLSTAFPWLGFAVGAVSLGTMCIPLLPVAGIVLNTVVLILERRHERSQRRLALGILGAVLSVAALIVQILWMMEIKR